MTISSAPAVLELDASIKAVWADHAAGRTSEIEADQRLTLLQAQRDLTTPPPNAGRPLGAALPISKFALRRYQRSPDREASRNRGRMLARGGHMPPGVRIRYTEGESSALTIIAGEVKRHGCCDLPIDKIAALAGVCRTTVQNALRAAVRQKHVEVQHRPVPGRKNLTNIIRITSRLWLTWLERGAAIGFKTIAELKISHPTKIQIFSTNRRKPARQEEREHGIQLESG